MRSPDGKKCDAMPSPGNQADRVGEQCVAELKIANALAMTGDMDAAMAHFRAALALNPRNHRVHEDVVYLLHFCPGVSDEAIFRELELWERNHTSHLAKTIPPHTNDRDPNRRLKIGYVSPDFRRQAESFFVLPLLRAHDRTQVEVHCYASVEHPDDRTDDFKKATDVWHDILPQTDADVADRIRTDGIDILVDLTMHMKMSRTLVFARKPAPVQVCWLAYPGGTGVRTMDWRLTDRFLDPPGLTEWYSEKSWRLPDCWVCYDPISRAALATPRTSGPVLFGCLNHPRKINEWNLRLWAAVLRKVEGSRLMLRAGNEEHEKRIVKILGEERITPDRIELKQTLDRWEYLRAYDRIDIALDTLPYNGITTTCDAMWMGTPVVTLTGKTAAGRGGWGILSTVGLPELVANSADRFVEIAVELAADRPRLVDFRRNLRRRIESSPLMDAGRFARNVEAAYREMWRNWCAGSATHP
jgi:protein O-GlcNAc transferase